MTDGNKHVDMHACIDGTLVPSVERDDLRDTRACDTRVIHERWQRAQVVIRDALSPHVGEARAAVQGMWPFSGRPFMAAAARLVADLTATPIRAVAAGAVIAVAALIAIVAHAAV